MTPFQRVRLFGVATLERDGASEPVVSTSKALALLGYLVHHEPVTRAHLATLLWGETTEYRSRRNLTHVLGQLNARLPGCFAADQQRVGWRHDAPVAVDTRECAALLRAGRTLARATPDVGETATSLAQAVELYRGELLADLTLSDSPEFDTWLLAERERWRQQIAGALATLGAHHASQGHSAAAERALRRWVDLEPWQEQAHRALMRLLAQNGRRAEALAVYERCQRLLAEELGIAPSDETVALSAQIRAESPAGSHVHTRALGGADTRAVAGAAAPPDTALTAAAPHAPRDDWGEAPEPDQLLGRTSERATLERWLADGRCRLVLLLGMGGMGKTTLATAVARAVAPQYGAVIWRSLLNAPPLAELLRACLPALSAHQVSALPDRLDDQIALLLTLLRRRRCLLVLDNCESLLEASTRAGAFRSGYTDYGLLLRRLAEADHQSCVLLTSRELPHGLEILRGEAAPVRVLHLGGLDVDAGQQLLHERGIDDPSAQAASLIARYSGNPLALQIVARTIADLFASDLGAFLRDETLIFDDIRDVLDQQWDRLAPLERDILCWLAVAREALPPAELRQRMVGGAGAALLEALRSLQRRALLEPQGAGFTLQNVVMEYVTERLVDAMVGELESGRWEHVHSHALITADAREYVRESQVRLILAPVAERSVARFGRASIEARVRAGLAALRAQAPQRPGYAAGNALNLLLTLGADLRGADCAGLCIWQAYLRGADLPEVDFRGADLRGSVFIDYAGAVMAVAFRPDGELLAVGVDTGTIYLWEMRGRRLVDALSGHGGHIGALAFSPDGNRLVSGSDDHTLRIWDLAGHRTTYVLTGHGGGICAVAFHPDGVTVASGSTDHSARVWDTVAGVLLHVLPGHGGTVTSLAFTPDGDGLVTGSHDHAVRVWQWRRAQVHHTLSGHSGVVAGVAVCPQPRIWGRQERTVLVSGSHDHTLRLWDVGSGAALGILTGHTADVTALALSATGALLVSAANDLTLRVWDLSDAATGERQMSAIRVLQGHVNGVNALAIQPRADGAVGLLASGSHDKTVRLWDLAHGHALAILRGHSQWLQALCFGHDGRLLVSGIDGQHLRVWDGATGRTLQILRGHTRMTEKLAFSVDGALLMSTSWDATARVWDLARGQARRVLWGGDAAMLAAIIGPGPRGQDVVVSSSLDGTLRVWEWATGAQLVSWASGQDHVVGLAVRPDGMLLATSSWDGTICLWALADGGQVRVLEAHAAPIESVAFDPSGALVAGGSWDRTVSVWDVGTGRRVHRLVGHTGGVEGVAFSADGALLASGACDQVACVWDMRDGSLRYELRGHTSWVRCVAFSADGSHLATASDDGTVRLWDISIAGGGACVKVVAMEAPYQGMRIGGATELTDAQRLALMALGAMET